MGSRAITTPHHLTTVQLTRVAGGGRFCAVCAVRSHARRRATRERATRAGDTLCELFDNHCGSGGTWLTMICTNHNDKTRDRNGTLHRQADEMRRCEGKPQSQATNVLDPVAKHLCSLFAAVTGHSSAECTVLMPLSARTARRRSRSRIGSIGLTCKSAALSMLLLVGSLALHPARVRLQHAPTARRYQRPRPLLQPAAGMRRVPSAPAMAAPRGRDSGEVQPRCSRACTCPPHPG